MPPELAPRGSAPDPGEGGRIAVAPEVWIEPAALSWQAIRAPGPGGQNVNKVSTAVQMRLDTTRCPTLSAGLLARLRGLAGRRMTADGALLITAHRFRSQDRNRQDALDRLLALLRAAAERPVPRRKTHVPFGQRQRRLEAKGHRAAIKRGRRGDGAE